MFTDSSKNNKSSVFNHDLFLRQNLACSILDSAIEQNKLSHSYLFTGNNQSDKAIVASSLAAYLNCQNRKESGFCLTKTGFDSVDSNLSNTKQEAICKNCQWINEQKHPQVLFELVNNKDPNGIIPVEKARQIANELNKTSSYFRLVIVPRAEQDSFHRPSANALLKTVEESNGNILFLFFANREEDVLPTIVSRCQIIPLKPDKASRKTIENEDLTSFIGGFFKNHHAGKAKSAAKSTDALTAGHNFAMELIDKFGNDYEASEIIDICTNIYTKNIKISAKQNKILSRYLFNVVQLGENIKRQLDSYVNTKAAFANYFNELWALRQKFPGDLPIG